MMATPSPSSDNGVDIGAATIPCLVWATFGALTGVISSTCVAYPNFLEQKHEEITYTKPRKTLHAIANIVFSLISVGCFIRATAYGPVALAMPLQTGISLLLNMIVQTVLRMKRYTKEMTAGTLVLVCAVIILVDVGPSEQHRDPIPLLLTMPAVLWNVACLGCCLVAALGIHRSRPGSDAQLLMYSVAISTTTVIGASVGKLMQEATGVVVYFFVGLYVLVGVLNLYWSAKAAGSTDISLLMPVKSSITLALNCVTGLLVWQDFLVIEAWTSYVMVYLLVLLGVYTCAAGVDFVSAWSLNRNLESAMLSQGVVGSSFGRAIQELINTWTHDSHDFTQTLPAMRTVLDKGLRTGAIKQQTLLDLCMRLLEKNGCGPSPLLMNWIKNDWPYAKLYAKHDPDFLPKIESLLRVHCEGGGGGGGEKAFDNYDQDMGSSRLDDSATTPLM
jgi:hypothetical protein